jgi:hypothetical protein
MNIAIMMMSLYKQIQKFLFNHYLYSFLVNSINLNWHNDKPQLQIKYQMFNCQQYEQSYDNGHNYVKLIYQQYLDQLDQ